MLIKPIKTKFFLIIGLLLLLGTQILAQQEQSGISTSDKKPISAKEFCEMLKRATANGAQQIIMINGQCFGGGFSCITTIGTSSSIFMKSASADTEVSWDNGWLPPLRDGFAALSTVFAADTYANGKDPYATTNREHPQGVYSGNAGTATLTPSSATSLHAILFAGKTTGRPDYAQELDQWYSQLTAKGYEVTKVYGGTRNDLENAFSSVSSKMNDKEALTVVIFDHGTRMAVETTRRTVNPFSSVTSIFTLTSSFGRAAGKADALPQVIVSSLSTTTTITGIVIFDGQPFGTFTTLPTFTPQRIDSFFDIFVELQPFHRIEIFNQSTVPIEIVALSLTGGSVPTQLEGSSTTQRVFSSGSTAFERLDATGVSLRNVDTISGVTVRTIRYNTKPPNPGGPTVLSRYWDISLIGGGDISGTLVFDYDSAEVAAAGMNENTMYIGRSTTGGASWEQVATMRNTFTHQLSTNITGFSLYAIGDAGAVPVELSTLQAKQK